MVAKVISLVTSNVTNQDLKISVSVWCELPKMCISWL